MRPICTNNAVLFLRPLPTYKQRLDGCIRHGCLKLLSNLYTYQPQNAALRTDFFDRRMFSTYVPACIPKQTDALVFYLSVTYFLFHFPLSLCFISMPDRTSTTNFRIFDWKFLSKSNCRHTANANELCSYAVPIQRGGPQGRRVYR